jgi:hypothetical protein
MIRPFLASALALAIFGAGAIFPSAIAQTPSQLPSEWRLVRTPNPRGGPDAVSIMRTADLSKSDAELAGLMLRCAPSGVEILIILIAPLSPRARPQVITGSVGNETRFDATVVPPGAAILLPSDASALLNGPWQSLPEISVSVRYDQTSIQGTVPLSGLSAALGALRANCP